MARGQLWRSMGQTQAGLVCATAEALRDTAELMRSEGRSTTSANGSIHRPSKAPSRQSVLADSAWQIVSRLPLYTWPQFRRPARDECSLRLPAVLSVAALASCKDLGRPWILVAAMHRRLVSRLPPTFCPLPPLMMMMVLLLLSTLPASATELGARIDCTVLGSGTLVYL